MAVLVYTEPEVRPTLSLGIILVLVIVAAMSATAAHVASRWGHGRRQQFFLVSAIGAAFLGLDDLIGIHESVGLTVHHWIAAAPRPERVGHGVLLVYALAACLCFWAFRDLVWSSPRARLLLSASAGASLIVALLDTVVVDPSHAVTHPLQAAAAVGLLLGYWALIDALVVEPSR